MTCGHGHTHKTIDEAIYCNRDLPIDDAQAATMARNLSPTQIDILQRLVACNEPMAYFKGGFWSLPSIGRDIAPTEFDKWRDRWSVTLQSLTALERIGLLARIPTSTNYDAAAYPGLRDFVLTERALQVAQHLTGATP